MEHDHLWGFVADARCFGELARQLAILLDDDSVNGHGRIFSGEGLHLSVGGPTYRARSTVLEEDGGLLVLQCFEIELWG